MITPWARKVIIGFIYFFLVSNGGVWALDANKRLSQYKLDVWLVERGLEQNSIFSIIQTADGYIWLGTLDGLVRFDGIYFKVFNKQNTEALRGNEIRALYEDSRQVLWIGTDGGLTRLKNGDFTPCPVRGGLSYNNIRAIDEDSKGTLWIASNLNGIACVEDQELVPFSADEPLGRSKVYSFLRDRRGNLWFGGIGGITKLTTDQKLFFYGKESGLICGYVYAICERHNGQLWIGTNAGLYLFQPPEQKFIRYGLESGLPNIQVVCLYEDKEKCLWGGTDGGGLIRFKDEKIDILSTTGGMASGFVYAIREDSEGSLWLGTLEGGLHRLRDTQFTTYTTSEGLLDDYIFTVDGTATGDIFIRTKKGINYLTKGESRYWRISFMGDSPMKVDGTGGLWLNTKKGLLYTKNGKERLFTKADGFYGRDITTLMPDRVGAIWIGTTNGLWRYYNGTFTLYSQNGRLSHTHISYLYLDRDNSLWIGTFDGGIFRLSKGVFTTHSPTETLVNTRTIECISRDKEGILYVGSRSGLHRLANGNVTHYSTHNGLLDNVVNNIFEDDLGNIWMGGRTGISRVTKKELADVARGKASTIHPLAYNEEDGMKSRFCQARGLRSQDGKLWFGTMKGVVMVDPANLKKNLVAPPVIIEELRVNGETRIKKKGETVVIPPGKNRLEFYYTAPSYIKSRKIQFKLKLEGYDKDWINVGNTRSNTYTALPPGHYTLRVIACNSDGVWNTKGDALSFYMTPFFYETTWFYVLVACFSILLVFAAFRFRVRQLKARERELSRLVDIRTQALHERSTQLEIAHNELRLSNQIIQEKNQNILSSIQYARKIQQAILPDEKRIARNIQDYFIFFKPRDIVSGDFYWFGQKHGKYYMAVVDCTGHGVPGALLSMIGNMKLNAIFEEAKNPDPAQLLLELHLGVRLALKQESDDSQSNDGMDAALCLIDLRGETITFSGARRGLYYVQDSQLLEIKGSRESIGGNRTDILPTFYNHVIPIDRETTLYITTDGFADQNNAKNKKYGSIRFKELLLAISRLPMALQKQALEEEWYSFRSNEEQRDDITVIGIKLKKYELNHHGNGM